MPHIFRSIQGRSGVGRGSTHTGARKFFSADFHSVGICVLGAAGHLAVDRHLLRTAFSFSVDRFRLGACSQARSARLRAILPSQCTHLISPYQYIPLSFSNCSSQASQLMHVISYMHNTHFEHILSYALLICVLCAAHLVRLDSRGIWSSGGPQEDLVLLRRGLQLVLVCVGAAPLLEQHCS